jgi:cell division protein FtsB
MRIGSSSARLVSINLRMIARISARLRLLARNEHGIALPTALFATIASLGLASAAVMASVDVQYGSKRDSGSKSAIGAADAGANVAMQRLNRHGDELSEADPCLNLNASEKLEAGDAPGGEADWCAPIGGEVGGAEYSYRVSALGSNACVGDYCIVSTGTADQVSRRIQLSLEENCPLCTEGSEQQVFEQELLEATLEENETRIQDLEEQITQLEEEASSGGGVAGLIGREEIEIDGNATIKVGVATNGWLNTDGNITICGDIQTGTGKPWTPTITQKQCSGYSNTQGTVEVPSVSSFIPPDIATNNSNARLTQCTNGLPADCQKDTYNRKWTGTVPFDPATRTIDLDGNGELTLGGGDYWLCSLTLDGNQDLIMAEGAHVRFFFDTPANCGGKTTQISIAGNSRISATGYQGKPGEFDMPGLYLLGSGGGPSQVNIAGNSSGNEFILYGPDTDLNISGNASKGMIVGRRVTIAGNAKIEQDDGFEVPPELSPGNAIQETIEGLLEELEEGQQSSTEIEEEIEDLESQPGFEAAGAFKATDYVECSGGATPTGVEPNSGC